MEGRVIDKSRKKSQGENREKGKKDRGSLEDNGEPPTDQRSRQDEGRVGKVAGGGLAIH